MAALPAEHAGQHEAGEDDGAGEVEVQDGFDLGLREVVELALRIAPGVVDEHVDRAEVALDGFDERVAVLGGCDVRRDRDDVASRSRQFVRRDVELAAGAGGKSDTSAALHERRRDVRTDAARAAGDERRSAVEVEPSHETRSFEEHCD